MARPRPLENVPVASIMVVARRAGLPEAILGDIIADPGSSAMVCAVELLLADAVREDARWARRVKLVESRAEFAVSALRGGHDDELG